VEEFPHVDERDLREALPILARRGVPLLVHAEDARVIAECGMPNAEYEGVNVESDLPVPDSAQRTPDSAFRIPHYRRYLASRPPAAERIAVDLMIRLAREFNAHVHIVHVACAEAVEAIARAKANGVRITAETCPHYLTFTAGDVRDGATEFKCAPPIREALHRQALWDGLYSGALDLVATDHSPAPPAMKRQGSGRLSGERGGDFITAWGGIASLELSLAAVFTAFDVERRLQPGDGAVDHSTLRKVAQWMSAAPAELAHLGARKGRIAVGYDADLVIWDPDAEWIVEPARLQQRHKLTPYAGRMLRGAVRETYLRGQRVWSHGAPDRPCAGTLV
jgi:allantoinase